MSIEYVCNSSGFAPQMVKMSPKANTAIVKGALVGFEISTNSTGKIIPATGANASAVSLVGICEETVASVASPPDVLVTILTPDMILKAQTNGAGTAGIVAGSGYDLDATGENLDGADGAVTTYKLQVISLWPGETRTGGKTAGAYYMCKPIIPTVVVGAA